jgi:hypothetical protein
MTHNLPDALQLSTSFIRWCRPCVIINFPPFTPRISPPIHKLSSGNVILNCHYSAKSHALWRPKSVKNYSSLVPSLTGAAISERVIALDNDHQMEAGSQFLLFIPVLLFDASDITLDGTGVPFTLSLLLLVYDYSFTHGAEPLSRSLKLCSQSISSRHFMKPECSSPCSQEPSIGPYPEPDQTNPYHPILFV